MREDINAAIPPRPFKDMGIWMRHLQPSDDAAHELIGRIVSTFGYIEYLAGNFAIDLAHTRAYQNYPNFRQSFPQLISYRLSFIRFCLLAGGPLSGLKDTGIQICDRLQSEFDTTRNLYAHAYVKFDGVHTYNWGIASYRFHIFKSAKGNTNDITSLEIVKSLDDMMQDYRSTRRLARMCDICINYARKNRNINAHVSKIEPSANADPEDGE